MSLNFPSLRPGLSAIVRVNPHLTEFVFLAFIRQSVSDAFLDRWCILPFDGRSDGVACSAGYFTGVLAGVWVGEEKETESDPEEHLQHSTTPFLVAQGSNGFGRWQLLSAFLMQRSRWVSGCTRFEHP